MLFVHTPVPPGRDMQASEDLFMDVDEPPSKRSRETPSSTQRCDFANPDEFVQRAQNVSVPLSRTPEQSVPAPETPFQPVPHGNVTPQTPPLFRSDEAMPSTPPFQCFPGGETAPVNPACGKLEICSACIILSSCVTSDAPHICSSIHVATLLLRTATQILLLHTFTFQRSLMRVTRNQQLRRNPMIHFSLTILL